MRTAIIKEMAKRQMLPGEGLSSNYFDGEKYHLVEENPYRSTYVASCYQASMKLSAKLGANWRWSDFKPEEHLIPWDQIEDKKLCNGCMRNQIYKVYTSKRELYNLVESDEHATKAAKIQKSTSAGAIQKRLKETQQRLNLIERNLTNGQSYGEFKKYANEVETRLKTCEQKLLTAGRSDDARSKLERKVQQEMVPSKYRDENFRLDGRMMLIGISPTPANSGGTRGDTVTAVLEAYAIKKEENTVLYAPAYFYTYLYGNLFARKGQGRILVVAAEAPESPEEREIAAMLWSPENGNTLGCLQTTIETAKEI